MKTDFHIHSIYSDGDLIPAEIVSRAKEIGLDAIAITDHVDQTNYELINEIKEIKDRFDDIKVYVGAELTHIQPNRIDSLIKEINEIGVDLILVHGETIVEPVPDGTNRAAVENEEVDILAHPGLINPEVVKKAKENNVFLELTARRGHCLTNGHVANYATQKNAKMLVNTDLHSPSDFITKKEAFRIAKGSGLSDKKASKVIEKNPKKLVEAIEKK